MDLNSFQSTIFIFLFGLIAGCDSFLNSQDDFVYSFQDSLEARKIASWYAAELQTPDHIFDQQLKQIKQLRNAYGETIPAANIRFMLPWEEGVLPVKFTKEASKAINEGSFEWSRLEPLVQPDTVLKYPDKLGWALLGFKKDLNPWRLAVRYNALPEVMVSEANLYNFTGFADFPLKLHPINNGLGYLFTSGSTHGPLHYFIYKRGRARYVGSWNRQDEEPPDWWEKIKLSISNFPCRGAPEGALCWNKD